MEEVLSHVHPDSSASIISMYFFYQSWKESEKEIK